MSKCTAMGCKNGKVALFIGFADCKECGGTGYIDDPVSNYKEDLDIEITGCGYTMTTDPASGASITVFDDTGNIGPFNSHHSWIYPSGGIISNGHQP